MSKKAIKYYDDHSNYGFKTPESELREFTTNAKIVGSMMQDYANAEKRELIEQLKQEVSRSHYMLKKYPEMIKILESKLHNI